MPSGWDWAAIGLALVLLGVHQLLIERRWRQLTEAIRSIRKRDKGEENGE